MRPRATLNYAESLERITRSSLLPEHLQGANWLTQPQIHRNEWFFVDGLNSSSLTAEEWIKQFRQYCFEVPEEAPVTNGFSYYWPTLHYDKFDTWNSLEQYIHLYLAHLSWEPSTKIIPISFSLGTNISLLGMSDLDNDSERTPAMILVAPAHNPRKSLIEEYQVYQVERGSRRRPTPIWELCGEDPQWRNRIAAAYHELTSRGIHIHVVYSPDDSFVAYTKPTLSNEQNEYLHLHEVTINEKPPTSPYDEVAYHIRLRSSFPIYSKICEILKGYL